MFRNYLTSAVRFIKHNKVFAAINLAGLSIALAASFIILLFVINELSYNRCHKNRRNVYRVLNYYNDFKQTMAGTPYVLAATMKQDFPQVLRAASIYPANVILNIGEERIRTFASGTSSDIFSIFTIPLIQGGPADSLLDDLNSLVISRDMAEKYFPEENPLGRNVTGLVNSKEVVFTIKGVFENIPVNSTFRAECFVNGRWTLDPINQSFKVTNADVNWTFDFWNTWLLLADGTDPSYIDKLIPEFEAKHINEKPHNLYSLQNLSDVYLKSATVANSGRTGNIKNIRLFSLIAILIIIVAAVNYIVLSTAVSSARSKEIGIRKTFGASNGNIRIQLLGESIMLVLIVMPIAVLLGRIALPNAGNLFQTKLIILPSNIPFYVAAYILMTVLIGIFSGIYTSSYLAGLKVIAIFRNTLQTGKNRQIITSVLIVIQLLIFSTFVSSTLIIQSQYKYVLKKDTGFYTSDVLIIELGRGFQGYSSFINNLKSNPNIIMAAGVMEALPMRGSMSTMYPSFHDPETKIKVEGLAVDYNFIKTMGIQILRGREFAEDFGSDLSQSCMLNETAVKMLGIENDPIGQKLGSKNIIGVVKDFNLHSLRTDIPPLSITMTDKYINQAVVHYRNGFQSNVIPFIESEWKKIAPGRSFMYTPIESMISSIYSSEKNLSVIVSIFAVFTLIIATIGLFGLILFTSRTKSKEIGVKKVFGSSGSSIIISFIKSNLILVVSATLISIPVTIFFMLKWLSNYAYRTDLSPWIFLAAFAVSAIVVTATIFFHSLKASRTNPVTALKYE
jgi:putative ABC transport system permease protein